MRIVVATDVTVPGGVDNYVTALIGALRGHGHDVIALVEQDTTSPIGDLAAGHGAKVVRAPLYRRWHDASVIANACRQALAEIRPTGIHIVTGSPRSCLPVRALAMDMGIPMIITEQQVDQRVAMTPEERTMIRSSYTAAIAVIFVASGNRDTMAAEIGLNDFHHVVVPNGVDLGRLEPNLRSSLRPRIPARLITAARLSHEKSLQTLIEAVRLLPEDLVTEVNVYGEGDARDELAQLIRSLQLDHRIRLRGWSSEIPRLLRQHDLFVLPSVAEGMPYALIEAMAVGLPAVCTDVPGNVEALADGAAGVLVRQGSADSLAAGIRTCLEHPELAEQRALLARELVRQRHDQAAGMNLTVNLWSRCGGLPQRIDAS